MVPQRIVFPKRLDVPIILADICELEGGNGTAFVDVLVFFVVFFFVDVSVLVGHLLFMQEISIK